MGGIFFLTALYFYLFVVFPPLPSPSPFKTTPAIAAGSASHHPDKQPLARFFWTSQALLFIVVSLSLQIGTSKEISRPSINPPRSPATSTHTLFVKREEGREAVEKFK